MRRSGLACLCLALDRCRHVTNPYTWYIFLLFSFCLCLVPTSSSPWAAPSSAAPLSGAFFLTFWCPCGFSSQLTISIQKLLVPSSCTTRRCFTFLNIARIHSTSSKLQCDSLKIPPTITSARTCPTCTNLLEAIAVRDSRRWHHQRHID